MTGIDTKEISRLDVEDVTVAYGDSARTVLADAGLAINADNIEAFRLVNPGVDIYDMRPGLVVKVPRNVHGQLRVDDAAKTSLIRAINHAAQSWGGARAQIIPGSGLDDVLQAGDEIVSTLTKVSDRLGQRTLVTNSPLLVILSAETSRFEYLLHELTPTGEVGAGTDIRELATTLRSQLDVNDQHKGVGGTVEIPSAHVTVKAVSRIMGAAVGGYAYTLWWALMGDINRANSIPDPTHPEVDLVQGRYAFWATKGSSTTPRLGMRKSILVTRLKNEDVVIYVDDTPQ